MNFKNFKNLTCIRSTNCALSASEIMTISLSSKGKGTTFIPHILRPFSSNRGKKISGEFFVSELILVGDASASVLISRQITPQRPFPHGDDPLNSQPRSPLAS